MNTGDNDQNDPLFALLLEYDQAVDTDPGIVTRPCASGTHDAEVEAEFARLRSCVDLLDRWRREKRLSEAVSEWDRTKSDPVPRRIGRFEVLQEIGRGGGGVVFLAKDPSLGRLAAIKIPRPEALVVPQLRERFLFEAQATAALDHPNIVSVHEVGEDGPTCFIAAAYCPGVNLSTWLAENDQPIACRDAAAMVMSLADAVQHAHSRGVLHRDIKPSNILLEGPHQVGDAMTHEIGSFQAKLTDFGLATFVETPSDFTKTGAILGTPAYMAPEQAESRKRDLAAHTDVWALGVVLYEMLTRRSPFRGESDFETLNNVSNRGPLSPQRLRDDVPADLAAICMKCIEKEPARRYTTAAQLVDDLGRFLARKATLARPISAREAAWRWVRHHPQTTAMITVLACAVVSLVAGLWIYNDRLVDFNVRQSTLNRELEGRIRETAAAKEQAELSDLQTRQMLYVSDIKLAAAAVKSGDTRQAVEFLNRHRPKQGDLDLRGFEWDYLWRMAHSEQITLAEDDAPLYCVRYSPDSRTVAAAGADGEVRIYNAETHVLEQTIRTNQGDVNGFVYSSDGQRLGTAGEDGTVRVWELASGRQSLVIHAHEEQAYNVLFHHSSNSLITCGEDPVIRIWNAQTGELKRVLDGHNKVVEAIALSPDGQLLVSASSDKTAILWAFESGDVMHRLNHGGRVTSVAFSHDGQSFVTGCLDRLVRVWEVDSWQPLRISRHLDGVQSVSFRPDDRAVAIGERSGTITVLPVEVEHWALPAEDPVLSCGVSPDGSTLAAVTQRQVVFRHLKTDETRELPSQALADLADANQVFPIHGIAFSATGNLLVVLNEIYHREPSLPAGWHLQATLDAGEENIHSVAVLPDERIVATGHGDGRIKLWDVEDGTQLESLSGHDGGPVYSIAVSPIAPLMASGGADRRVVVWDLATREQRAELTGHTEAIRCVAYSPDGRYLASSAGDDRVISEHAIRLWDANTDEARGILEVLSRNAGCQSIAFSPDSKLLAATGSVLLWDVALRSPLLDAYRPGPAPISAVAFLPDSSTLVTAGPDNHVRLRKLSRRTFSSHEDRVYSLQYSPDGTSLISAGKDGRLVLSSTMASPLVRPLEMVDGIRDFAWVSSEELAIAGAHGLQVLDSNTGHVKKTLVKRTLSETELGADSLAYSSSADRLATRIEPESFRLSTLRSDQNPTMLKLGDGFTNASVAMSPSGDKLVVAGDDQVCVFNGHTAAPIASLPAAQCTVVAFSRDGRYLATNSLNTVVVWDTATWNEQWKLDDHTNTILAAAFSPDASQLVSAARDRRVILWDVDAGALRHSAVGHRDDIRSVSFSPNGQTFVTAGYDRLVKAWNTATGQPLLTLGELPSAIFKVSFSPDGRHIACLRYGEFRDRTITILDTGGPDAVTDQ